MTKEQFGLAPKIEEEGLEVVPRPEVVPKPEEEKAEVKEAVKEMPKAEREKTGFGLSNMGYYVEEKKNSFFSKVFKGASEGFDKKSMMGRWLESFSENYTKDAQKAKKKMEQIEKGEKHRFGNVAYLGGNALRYGRVATDLVGYTMGSPFRYVMMAGMFFSRGAEAAKEARLKNEEVIEKTRVHDIDQAAEEAWKIYDQAKSGKEEVSKNDLEKAYQQNTPKDLLKRLKKEAEPGMATGILQKIIRWDVEKSVKGIEKKIKKIEVDKKLSKKEQKLRAEKIINKYSKHLNDLDGMVSQYGTVDSLAMGAKYTKTAAKAVVGAMMVETAGLAIQKLWDSLPNILSVSEAEVADLEGGKARMPITKEEVAVEKPGVEEPKLKTRGIKPLEETLKEAEELEAKVEEQAKERMLRDAKIKPLEDTLKEAEELEVEEAEREAIVIGDKAVEAEVFEIAEKVEIKRGDSIWSVAEKYLKGNKVYQELIEIGDKDTVEALETYNIDRVKDIIVANPQDYGLPAGVDVDKLTIAQLKGINWEKAFADTFPEGKGLTDGLTQEQIDSIVENNKTLRTFFQEHPDAPRTSENYEDILKGKGVAGEVAEAKETMMSEAMKKALLLEPSTKEFIEAQAALENTEISSEERLDNINESLGDISQSIEKNEALLADPKAIPEKIEYLNKEIDNLKESEKLLKQALEDKTYEKPMVVGDLLRPEIIEPEGFKTIIAKPFESLSPEELKKIDNLFIKYLEYDFKTFSELPQSSQADKMEEIGKAMGDLKGKIGTAPNIAQEASGIRKLGEAKMLGEIWDKYGPEIAEAKTTAIEAAEAAKKAAIEVQAMAIENSGLNPDEWEAIKDVKVGKLLEEIPSKDKAWAIWRGEVEGENIELPHHGAYSSRELGRHIKLTEFIRKEFPLLDKSPEAKDMTVNELLRTLGTEKAAAPGVEEAKEEVVHDIELP